MTLTLGVDAYATVAEADTYLAVYPPTNVWNTATTVEKEAALKAAVRIIDNKFVFLGKVVAETQALSWPRSEIKYYDKKRKHTVTIAASTYPTALKNAVIELANHLMTFPSVFIGDNQTFERIKIGPIEVEDTNADIATVSLLPNNVRFYLKDLLEPEDNRRTWWRAW